ncbi:MAG: PAS domain S-box protein [Deltaproteobacteria bacterium]|jgi:PAS domain S-box-containing protein|nr:PAS domain S-box protein [Deltaproteobacteria bacterium]
MSKKPSYKDLEQDIKALEKEKLNRMAAEKALQQSEEKYRLLVKNLPSVVYKGYPDWSVEFFDSKIEQITGYGADQFNSKKMKWKDVVLPEDLEAAREIFITALKTDKSYVREYRIKSKQGGIHWIQERGQIICNDKREIEYVSGVFFDITDTKQAQEKLRKSEEMARALLNATTDAVVLLDQEGIILDINDTYAQKFQKTPDEMVGLCIWYLFSYQAAGLRMINVNKVFKTGLPVRVVDEQHGIWHDTVIYPVSNPGGEVKRVAVFARDITDRKLAEEHVHTLSQQLLKTRELERQRISRDLHDNVAQELSLLKISWETLFDNHPLIPDEIRQKTSQLSTILQRSISAIRDMAYDLHPPGLYQLGLVHTIYQYCEEFSEKNELDIDFFAAGMDDLKIPSNTEINLYRLIQEGLWNIKKHAEAAKVTVKLVASFPNIILRIEDDGKGFNIKERLTAASKEKRMGLRSMEERVSLLNGKMKIQSRPNEGTKVFIEVPYKEKKRG